MLPALALLPACVVLDTSPAEGRLAYLTDEDADGYTLAEGDCNDHDPAVHPDAVDDCDGADTNCDGRIDEAGLLEPLCRDDDGDGHGDPATSSRECELAEGRVVLCDDCEDHDPAVSPAASERCDGYDNNCDGRVDGEDSVDQSAWYRDADQDGYGDSEATEYACTSPGNHVAEPGDCNDSNEFVHPGVEEVCGDGEDTNCDGDDSLCGFWGDITLDSSSVDPSEGGFIRGSAPNLDLALTGVMIVDTLADGSGDVVLSSPRGADADERLDLWYSAPVGQLTEQTAHLSVRSPTVSYLGTCGTLPVGDVDGDGRRELLLCAPLDMDGFPEGGRVFALPVGSSGTVVLGAEEVVLEQGPHWSLFSRRLAWSETIGGGAGLVVGSYEESFSREDRGKVEVFLTPLGTAAVPVATIIGAEEGDNVGDRQMLIADDDGDGIDDLLLSVEPHGSSLGGSVRVLRGHLSESGSSADADLVIEDGGLEYVGMDLAMHPDLDGDGNPEIVVGSGWRADVGDPHVACWLPGGLTGTVNLRDRASLTWTFDADSPTSLETETGDVNGDGELDLIGAASGMSDDRGAVYGYYGPLRLSGTEDFSAQSSFVRRGAEPRTYVGDELAVGDVNADGADDLLFYAEADLSQYLGGAWFLFGEGI